VAADLVVAAGVRVLVAQAAEDLHGGVTLLGRGVLVSGQDVVDNLVKGTQYGRGRRLGARVRGGLWLGEDLADLPPRVAEDPGDLAYAHAVAVREANPGVVVHRQHPCLRSVEPLGDWPYWNGCGWGGSILLADPAAGGGSLLRADNQGTPEDGRRARRASRLRTAAQGIQGARSCVGHGQTARTASRPGGPQRAAPDRRVAEPGPAP